MSIPKTLTKINQSGFSDPFVAKALGLSTHTVFNYRTGKRTPDYNMGQKIVAIGGLVDKFLAGLDEIAKQ